MAFPSDTGPFQNLGPEADIAGVREIAPGRTIGGDPSEPLAMLQNGHILWTNTNRARVLELSAWGEAAGSEQPWATTSSVLLVEVARCPVDAATDRTTWTVYADLADGDVTVSCYTSGGVLVSAVVLSSVVGRTHDLSGALSPGTTTSYVTIELNAIIAPPDAALYGLRIYEDNVTT